MPQLRPKFAGWRTTLGLTSAQLEELTGQVTVPASAPLTRAQKKFVAPTAVFGTIVPECPGATVPPLGKMFWAGTVTPLISTVPPWALTRSTQPTCLTLGSQGPFPVPEAEPQAARAEATARAASRPDFRGISIGRFS